MADLTKKQQVEVKEEVKKQVEQQEIIVEKRLHRKLFEKTVYFGSEYKKQTLTAITAAFGLVIALSWQAVIRKIIDSIPKSGIFLYHPYITDLYTAIIVTAISVSAIIVLSKWAQTPEKKP